MSSIFQKTSVQDDIDAEMLKHVQFAAQRSSFGVPPPAADSAPEASQSANLAPTGSKAPLQPPVQQSQSTLPSAQSALPQAQQPASQQALPALQQLQSAQQHPASKELPLQQKTLATGEFTLASIEQSIAEIEAELGWVPQPVDHRLAAAADILKEAAADAQIPPGRGFCWSHNC